MKLYLVASFFILISDLAESKENIKKLINPRPAGAIFDHFEIQDYCLKKDLCEKEGLSACQSTRAKFLRCSEQYKENWIVTCICLK